MTKGIVLEFKDPIDKMFWGHPGSQVIYVEKEYNSFFNSCFQKRERYNEIFSTKGYEFIYIPDIITKWKNNPIYFGNIMDYYHPECQGSGAEHYLSNMDTHIFTEFIPKVFKNTTLQISNGLLVYDAPNVSWNYYTLLSDNEDELIKEIYTLLYTDEEQELGGSFFSLPVREDELSQEEKADYYFTYGEADQIANEIREKMKLLKKNGFEKLLLDLIAAEASFLFSKSFHDLSSIVIDKEYRIILIGFNKLEIKMSPLPKAVYFLFLRHPEGILFKNLPQFQSELEMIYKNISLRENIDDMRKSIQDICNPAENSINEKCSRIKEAFVKLFDENIAQYYFITGQRGCAKNILLDREYVYWEREIK